MDSYKSAELKKFMSNLNSDNLLQLLESNQTNTQDKYNTISNLHKKNDEEKTKLQSASLQNSLTIEKFENQLKEVSNHNVQLSDQVMSLQENNEHLQKELQLSEEKFAKLDIIYDKQTSDLVENHVNIIKQNDDLKMRNINLDQILTKQTKAFNDLNVTFETLNAEYEQKLKSSADEFEEKIKRLQLALDQAKNQNESLSDKITNYDETLADLRNNHSRVLNENKEIKNELDKLKGEKDEYRNEQSQQKIQNDELKLTVEDLKTKLLTKQQETEELCSNLKQLSRHGTQNIDQYPSSLANRKLQSSDAPKPIIGNSSDSDESTMSMCHLVKHRKISTETDDENQFIPPKKRKTIERKRVNFGFSFRQNQVGHFAEPRIRPQPQAQPQKQDQDHIEIPESPIVSSSAYTEQS